MLLREDTRLYGLMWVTDKAYLKKTQLVCLVAYLIKNNKTQSTFIEKTMNIILFVSICTIFLSTVYLVSGIDSIRATKKYLLYEACVANNTQQEFSYDEQNEMLKYVGGSSELCVFATGASDPLGLANCDTNDKGQIFMFNNSEFASLQFGTCLDVYENIGPEIDEWECKNPDASDAGNQLWVIQGNQIASQMDTEFCMTATVYNASTKHE